MALFITVIVALVAEAIVAMVEKKMEHQLLWLMLLQEALAAEVIAAMVALLSNH